MSSRLDRELANRLNNLNAQNEKLTEARGAYLLKEAERKHFEASQIVTADGKSMAEKTVNAQATPEWASFQRELARLETQFEFEKLRYEILDRAFNAEYLSMKMDAGEIKKQGVA